MKIVIETLMANGSQYYINIYFYIFAMERILLKVVETSGWYEDEECEEAC